MWNNICFYKYKDDASKVREKIMSDLFVILVCFKAINVCIFV